MRLLLLKVVDMFSRGRDQTIFKENGILSFPGGSDGKESACNVGNLGSIPGLERSPGGGNGNPFQYSCLEKCHGQMSLAGYNPCGRKEVDTTEHKNTNLQAFTQ